MSRALRLTPSGRYYVKTWGDTIMYYDLNKKRIPLAKAICMSCGDIMKSKRCGDFIRCKCGESFVDTDRWNPERHRYGGGKIIVLDESYRKGDRIPDRKQLSAAEPKKDSEEQYRPDMQQVLRDSH